MLKIALENMLTNQNTECEDNKKMLKLKKINIKTDNVSQSLSDTYILMT